MPTGDWFDRVRPSIELFRQLYASQERKPHLVITGANSFNRDYIGASAPKIVNCIKALVPGIPPDEVTTYVEWLRSLPQPL